MDRQTGFELATWSLVCLSLAGGAAAALSWTYSVLTDVVYVLGFFAALIAGAS